MEKIHFEWKKEYSVNVDEIDSQHKELIKIVDDLYQSIMEKSSGDIIAKTLKKLNDYSKYHFGTEEKYFKEFNYKDMAGHTAEHKKFEEDILGMTELANNDKLDVFELLFYLENWWINHILNSDKKYSEFFNEKGLH